MLRKTILTFANRLLMTHRWRRYLMHWCKARSDVMCIRVRTGHTARLRNVLMIKLIVPGDHRLSVLDPLSQTLMSYS